jgi:hypothetical protein
MSLKRIAKLGIETSAALIGSAFSAMLLVLTAMHAGPLWRDETNTFNLAHMPSLRDIWHNLQFDSFASASNFCSRLARPLSFLPLAIFVVSSRVALSHNSCALVL